jgi:hypothetical protein
MLRVCLLVAGQPRGNEEYRLVIDDKLTLTGISDGEGWIEVQIPPNAAQGKLTIGGDPLEPAYTLDLGGLDPITEPTGLQQRLHNLGFHCDATGRMDDATCAALSVFQQAEGQDVTGKPNRATLDKLKKRSGC